MALLPPRNRTLTYFRRILPLVAMAFIACGREGAPTASVEASTVRTLQALNVCPKDPYTLSLAALVGPGGTDVYATLHPIAPAECPVPDLFKFVSIDSRSLKFADL